MSTLNRLKEDLKTIFFTVMCETKSLFVVCHCFLFVVVVVVCCLSLFKLLLLSLSLMLLLLLFMLLPLSDCRVQQQGSCVRRSSGHLRTPLMWLGKGGRRRSW